MNWSRVLIFCFVFSTSSAQANGPHDFDFQSLKNCFLQTNSNHPERNHPDVQSHSRFVSTLIDESSLDIGTQYNHQLNALMFSETQASQTLVHVIQDVGGPGDNGGALFQSLSNRLNRRTPNIRETFVFNNSQLASRCDSRQPQNVIQVGGTCTYTTAESEGSQACPTTAGIGFTVSANGPQSLCGVTHSFGERRGFSQRRDLPLSQTRDVVERALVDRLNYLQTMVAQPGTQLDQQNIINALSPDGSCHNVISPTPPAVSALSSRILCLLQPQNRQICIQGDPGPSLDGPQNVHSLGNDSQVAPPALLVPTRFEIER